jgi:hypothetical protein
MERCSPLANSSRQGMLPYLALVFVWRLSSILQLYFVLDRVSKLFLRILIQYFHYSIVMGPNIPRIDPIRGGFVGGIRTRYRSFFPSKISKMPTYEENSASEWEDEYDNRPSAYSHKNYYQQQQRRPSRYGNVKFTLET